MSARFVPDPAQSEALDRATLHAPAPIALAVEALRNTSAPAQQALKIVQAFRVTVHMHALLALALRVRTRLPENEPEKVRATLRVFASVGHLTEGQWLALLKETLAPYAAEAEKHCISQLVAAFHGRLAVSQGALQVLQGLRNRVAHHDGGNTPDDEVPAELDLPASMDESLPKAFKALCGLLKAIEPLWASYRLVATAGPAPSSVGHELHGVSTSRAPVAFSLQSPLSGLALCRRSDGSEVLAFEHFFRSLETPAGGFDLLLLSERDRKQRAHVVYVSPRNGGIERVLNGWEAVKGDLFLATAEEQLPAPTHERPYRGLLSFDGAHADQFFGRQAAIRDVVVALDRHAVVLLAGASASGKTSLLHAGVVPELAREERMYRSVHASFYKPVSLRPWLDPWKSLSDALRGAMEGSREGDGDATWRNRMSRALDGADEEVGTVLAAWSKAEERRLILLVDQAEELFTLCADVALRVRFVNTVVAACVGGGAHAVFSVRDDHALNLWGFGALATLAETKRKLLTLAAPSAGELREMLEEPLRPYVGSAFEEGLAGRIVEAVHRQPAALALMQFAADQLWLKCAPSKDEALKAGRTLRHNIYDEVLHGVDGALALYADQVFDPPKDQESRLIPDDPTEREETSEQRSRRNRVMRELLLRAVAHDGSRQPVRSDDVPDSEDAADRAIALDRLVRGRLMTVRERGFALTESTSLIERETVYELVHETLVTRWSRFVKWRADDAKWRPLQRELHAAALSWDARDRSSDDLWRGRRSDDAAAMCKTTNGPLLTRLELAFSDASAEAERRRRRALRVGVAVAFVAALAVALVTSTLWRRSEKQALLAQRATEREREESRAAREATERERRQSQISADSRGSAIDLLTCLLYDIRTHDDPRSAFSSHSMPSNFTHCVNKYLVHPPHQDDTQIFFKFRMSLLFRLGDAQIEDRDFQHALESFSNARNIAKQATKQFPSDRTWRYDFLVCALRHAYTLRMLSRFDQARNELQSILTSAQDSRGEFTPITDSAQRELRTLDLALQGAVIPTGIAAPTPHIPSGHIANTRPHTPNRGITSPRTSSVNVPRPLEELSYQRVEGVVAQASSTVPPAMVLDLIRPPPRISWQSPTQTTPESEK